MSDSQIAAGVGQWVYDSRPHSSANLVEEAFESVLIAKRSPASARRRIFHGTGETKLTALACSEPPQGRADGGRCARWRTKSWN